MLAISNLHVDPRVERAARALAAAGFRVRVIYPDAYPPYFDEAPIDWGESVTLLPLSSKACEFVSQPPWLLGEEMHAAARLERPFAFHCHDLTTAIIGLSAARATGSLCIADFHEWYSENVSWDFDRDTWGPHPPLKHQLFRAAEKLLLWRADAIITVCDSIAEELEAMAPFRRRKVEVIRNIPPLGRSRAKYRSLKETLDLPSNRFLLLWQGGTGPSRLLEPVIRSLVYAPNVTFVIRGPSLEYYGDGYRAVAKDAGVADRLVLLPPVPSADVVDAAVGADAGIWTLPNLSKNFYYALPNKIFEYMAAGLPVLAANFPEARRMVEGNNVGLCFDPYDPESIAAQVRRLAEEPSLAERCRAAIPVALRELRADREWDKLVRLYSNLSNGPAPVNAGAWTPT
jgi:glycosyltransferase involved in cell wall biosynthesis